MPHQPVAIVEPTEWSKRGEAIVNGEHRRMLVFGGIPGESERVAIEDGGRHQVYARFLEPAGRPSPHRRRPPCDRYLLCGGCPLMHLDLPGQDRARLAMVRQAFAQEGLEALVPDHVVASPDGQDGYRYTAKMGVGVSDRGSLRLGAFARGTRGIVPIPNCQVVTPEIREAMRKVSYHVIDLDVRPYDPSTERGLLRYVVLRQSRVEGTLLVTMVAARHAAVLEELAQRILQSFDAVAGVHVHYNDTPGNAIFDYSEGDARFRLLGGRPRVEDRLGDVRYLLGPGDFFQANPSMAERMVDDVLDWLQPWSERPVVDLYCGVGAFTLPLARRHGFAIGVERSAGAVLRARENARLNRISAEFMSGPVQEQLEEVGARTQGQAPVVIVDPARRGLDSQVIAGLDAIQPSALAYVSCNPRSLARDLSQLRDYGWTVQKVQAYDMFPQTSHVEMMALVVPKAAPTATRRASRRKVVR